MAVAPQPETHDQWHAFLHELLEGQHSRIRELLGSPAEVIRVILRDANDPAGCRAAFESALTSLVGMWQPHERAFATQYLCMFDILGAFTPDVGCSKLLRQFELVGGWPLIDYDPPISNPGSYSYLHASTREVVERSALLALEQYFPVLPQSDSGLFESYKNLLFSKLRTFLWPYCLRRLSELAILRPYDAIFVAHLTRSSDELLEGILPVIVGTGRSIRSELLVGLFSQVLLHDLRPRFEAAAKIFNCQLLDDEQYPVLRTPFEDIIITLDRQSREFSIYAASRLPSKTTTERILRALEEDTGYEEPHK